MGVLVIYDRLYDIDVFSPVLTTDFAKVKDCVDERGGKAEDKVYPDRVCSVYSRSHLHMHFW